jgi:hypothetical protein
MCVRELYILFVNYNKDRLASYSCKKKFKRALTFLKKIFKAIARITRFREFFFKIEQQQKKIF